MSKLSAARAVVATIGIVFLATSAGAFAAEPPPGFVDEVVVPAASFPVALDFTPDGRMLMAEKNGRLLSYDPERPSTPMVVLDVSTRICVDSERGLLGVAVDPEFVTTKWIYVFYTRKVLNCSTGQFAPPVERVSRFTLDAFGVAIPNSELVLLDGIPNRLGIHNGGDLAFGKDGNLYVSTGDGGCDYAGDGCADLNDASRDRHSLVGKILRITRSGGIPGGNPYAGGVRCNTGNASVGKTCAETWAMGFRNPFRIAMDPNAPGVKLYANDVGSNTWEEINNVLPGRDYGWNVREGKCARASRTNCTPVAGFTDPIFAYDHNIGCSSVVGSAFVPRGIWPAPYDGAYLFGDYTCGKLFYLPENGIEPRMETFTPSLEPGGPITAKFGPAAGGQAFYYTGAAATGFVRRIRYVGAVNRRPHAELKATPTAGTAPLNVTFDAAGSRDPDGDQLTYRFTPGDGTPPVTTAGERLDHTYAADGTYTASVVAIDPAGLESTPATARVDVGNTPPAIEILAPASDFRFAVGQEIVARVRATDAQDGELPGSAVTWTVDKRHNDHMHPYVPPTSGSEVRFVGPAPEDLPAVLTSDLRVTVRAEDSTGLATTRTFTISPKIVDVTVAANKKNATLSVDGIQFTVQRTFKAWSLQPLRMEASAKAGFDSFKRWRDYVTDRVRIIRSANGDYHEAIYAVL